MVKQKIIQKPEQKTVQKSLQKAIGNVYTIEKPVLYKFLDELRKSFDVIAPVKKDLVRFKKIDGQHIKISDIYLEKQSYFSVKDYFFKEKQVMFRFNKTKVVPVKTSYGPRIFFGLRRCDLNGIMRQDMAFGSVNDPYYLEARENTYLFGYHCNVAPSEYCFCGSMKLKDFHDLMFYDRGGVMFVETGSEKGEKLLKKYIKFFDASDKTITAEDKYIPGADRLEDKDISKLYDHPDWKKGVDMCLSCGACTAVCPTCYCTEIHDESQTGNSDKAERIRTWSSCQLQSFTQVAGGHIFRKDRAERFKHRIFHQLEYFKEKNGVDLCVGCGRCISGCPTRIDFVEIINGMKHNKRKI